MSDICDQLRKASHHALMSASRQTVLDAAAEIERLRLTARDHFAAAALTGLMAGPPAGPAQTFEEYAAEARRMADAMLRVRDSRNAKTTDLDAAPAAKANSRPLGNPVASAVTGTGKQTAPPCVETDGFSSDSRPGQINRPPECESPRRECGESQRRDVPQPDNGRAAGGPAHHISEAEIDALEFVVEEGRIASIGDYGILRQLLIRLRREWEFRPEPYVKNDEQRGDSPTIRDTTPMRNGTPAEGSVPREGTEPVAWAVVSDSTHEIDCEFVYADEVTAGDVALEFNGGVVPLYRRPPCQGFSQKNLTLAGDERDALLAMAAYLDTRGNIQMQAWGSLLRILERRLA